MILLAIVMVVVFAFVAYTLLAKDDVVEVKKLPLAAEEPIKAASPAPAKKVVAKKKIKKNKGKKKKR